MNGKKLIAILVALGAFVILVFTIGRAVYYSPSSEITPTATTTVDMTAAQHAGLAENVSPDKYPVRFEIPKIGVSAKVQYVGVRANGEMGIPSNFTDVAWYKYGTVPGYEGSSVIVGHVDNAIALPGVFKHLSELVPGDDVYVTAKDGTQLHFRVTKLATYPYKNAPADAIFNDASGKYLNLITCTGTWIQSARSYDQRLVVYTKLVE